MTRQRPGRESTGVVRGATPVIDSRVGVGDVFREEAGRLIAWLVRSPGDVSIAEEIVQAALVAALEQWSVEGVPDSPRAWLQTIARRRLSSQC